MAAEEVRRVRTGAELSVGDEIEAWHNGKLFHRGRVLQTVASMDLVWIHDSRTGTRRLIDVEALVVLRESAAASVSASAPATVPASAATVQGPAGFPAPPTPDTPLFQAPSLAN